MGVWAFYYTCSQEEIDFHRNGKKGVFKDKENIPYFQYTDMGKIWHGLHIFATKGLTDPCQDDLISNAIAGQYHLWGKDEELIENKCWWWDFYSRGYNSNFRVKKISQALNEMDFNKIVPPKHLTISSDRIEVYIKTLEILQEFYQNASANNLAVIVSFG